ncbi:SGNH/GDSL hydrolase family protein [Amycolatopsis anabasis]|uniref:SGNH/GDSL hydrolase family protein n=1 Tax=Amycolatopsis anabasis TaxID=1840409 RepID=UPI00131D3850|nr:SGNH/GDSL hydrolase family protein [Amycolatopsis anabasis]
MRRVGRFTRTAAFRSRNRWERPIRSLSGLGAAVAVVLALTGFTSVAGVAPANYVALGDSYVDGTGAGGKANAYPRLWADTHPVASFEFPAVGGATTDDVLASQVRSLSDTTTLVTISIGGNDAGFSDVMTTCKLGSDAGCTERVDEARKYAKDVLPGKLDRVYAEIKTRAPNARVVVLGYPRLFDPDRFCDMSRAKVSVLNTAADELSDGIAERVRAAGFTYADVRDRFADHGICAGAPWLNGLTFPIVNSYHPNRAGHRDGYLPALNAITG